MKSKTILLVVLLATCGCERITPSRVESVESRVRSLIGSMSEATPKSIAASADVRTNLLEIADAHLRRELLGDWIRKLIEMDVSRLEPARQVKLLISAGHVLEDAVMWCMQDMGATYEECWSVRLAQIRRLDEAIERLDPDRDKAADSMHEAMVAWHDFRALVEYRERVVEKHECNDLYRNCSIVSDIQYCDVREQLEKLIHRSVRPENQILHLGQFVRLASERVRAREMKALEKYHGPEGLVPRVRQDGKSKR